jgi:hypothetical protein
VKAEILPDDDREDGVERQGLVREREESLFEPERVRDRARKTVVAIEDKAPDQTRRDPGEDAGDEKIRRKMVFA